MCSFENQTKPRMYFRLLLLATLLAGTCTIQSCSKKTTPATVTDQSKIGIGDDGKTYTLKVGEKIEATFNECIGCAQVWRAEVSNSEVVATLPNTYSNKSCTDCVGGNQDNTFHLEAKKAGTSTITFAYFDKKVTVTIVVN